VILVLGEEVSVPADPMGTDHYSCAVCGERPTRCVIIHVGAEELLKDLCQQHLHEVMAGARPIQNTDPARKEPMSAGWPPWCRSRKWRSDEHEREPEASPEPSPPP
jgi:hypothetical protein